MAEEEDPQRIKRIAAAAYDYDNDPRWAGYWSNVLIPPHMASRSDVVDHFKRKFYQRHIDPGLVVEPMSSSSSSQSSRSSMRSGQSGSSGSSVPPEQARSQNSGTSAGTNRTAPAGSNANSVRFDRQTIQFSINAWVFVLALLAILPFVPRDLANKAYRLSLLGMVSSSLYSLYNLYGKPSAWNLPAVQTWFQSIIVTKDFIYFVYCLMFLPFPANFKFALLPLLSRVVEHNAKYLRRNFSRSSMYRKYFEEICIWVEANTTTLNILSSNAEITLGFLLILSLFSWQRNIIQAFIYWQLLKLMYHAPATASYHQSVWSKIGRTVTPYIHRYTPFLSTPLSAVQRWWLS